jgi:[acyl-carrier-protein] S-malonyltransferase
MAPMARRALLFPGQGSHADGMDEPYRGTPLLERGLDILGHDPFTRLHEGTRFQQPALFLCSVCAHEQAQPDPDDVAGAAGHSLGEYAALVAAGVLTFEDALRVVAVRAAAMADAAQANPGGMVAMLGGDEAAVRQLADRLDLVIANDNAPGQLVLAGASDAIGDAEAQAREVAGARARRLDVTGAFHSPLMAAAKEPLARALAEVEVRPARFPVLSNGTVEPFEDVRAELVANLLRPVRWRETLLALQERGATEYDELGPGRVLSGMVKRTLAVAA